MFRIGFGYDVHSLVEGKSLILGGVKIPYIKGLLGYSDADVLTHAIIDAILGALGKGDIGRHFPGSDPAYKGVDSLFLLKEVMKIVQDERLKVNNLDATMVAQKPRLVTYLNEMIGSLSTVLEVDPQVVNLKATTTEGLGFCG
ncbi:MAG: 2-C-methyl-D-erythritol 2,4-cyclodiphosphate synthase, partial [Thermodesulfobacteriota bacterium]